METNGVHEVVHTLRAKPEYVRQRIALSVAGGATLLVALGWVGVMNATGAFSLAPAATLAVNTAGAATKNTETGQNNFTQLLGAASVAMGGATSSPATITVVNTKTYSTLDQHTVPQEQTVIHF